MHQRYRALVAACAVLVWAATPARSEAEKNADELRRIENVAVELQIDGDLPEACVGSVTALKDLAQLILSTSRIPVLDDAAKADYIVAWKFSGSEMAIAGGESIEQCVTIAELDVHRWATVDGSHRAKLVAFESGFHVLGRANGRVLETVRKSVSRSTSNLVREILIAKQAEN